MHIFEKNHNSSSKLSEVKVFLNDQAKLLNEKIKHQTENFKFDNDDINMEINKFKDLAESNLLTSFIDKILLQPEQIKNYMASRIAKMLYLPTDIPNYYKHLNEVEILDITKHIALNLPSMQDTISVQDLNFPNRAQKCIDSQLRLFSCLSNEETIMCINTQIEFHEIKNCWPFLNEIVDSYTQPCQIEMNYVVNNQDTQHSLIKTINNDVMIQLSQFRYHFLIKLLNRQIIICYQPHKGYLIQDLQDNLMLIMEYDLEYQKSGYYCIYNNNELKMILQYNKNLLIDHSCYLINGQVSVMAEFKDNQPHGILRVINASRKILYGELFHQGCSLLTITNLLFEG